MSEFNDTRTEPYALMIEWRGDEEAYRVLKWHEYRGAYFVIASCDNGEDAEEIIGAMLLVDEERERERHRELEAIRAELRESES